MKAKVNNNIFEQIGRSKEVESAVVKIAGDIVTEAKATAPVDSGDYKSSFEVEVHRGKGRVVARAVSRDPGALAIEARTGTLQRAGRSVKR